MKPLAVFLWVILSSTTIVHAQYGGIRFANNAATAVTNGLTGQRASGMKVTLYVGPDGTTNDSLLVPIATTNLFVPGLFNGGDVQVPSIAPDDYGIFQIRLWEPAFGNTYEEAAQAPPQGGRTALLGKSNLVRARVNPYPQPPASLTQYGLQPVVMTATAVPSISIDNIVVSEGTNGTKEAIFTVTLLPASTNSASVDFATLDGSALAAADYVATNGTLRFAAGETAKAISVTLTADSTPEPDEDFFVQLTNSVGAYLAQPIGRCTITEVRVTGIQMAALVTFTTLPGHQYAVEKSDDWVNWTLVEGAENVTGTGNLTTVLDRTAGSWNQQRIYRARLLE